MCVCAALCAYVACRTQLDVRAQYMLVCHSKGTQGLVVVVQRHVSSGGIVGALAGWRARHLGLVSYLAPDGATLCIEPRGKSRPMCMRTYVHSVSKKGHVWAAQ